MESLEDRRLLATWTVNTDVDESDGVAIGGISLRDAIFEAAPLDTIDFNVSPMNGATIFLDPANGEIAFAKSLTIDASMLSNGITIDASGTDLTPGTFDGQGTRIFSITDLTGGTAPPLVTLVGLTLTGADTFVNGGAIYSQGRLDVQKCTIESNFAANGAGIYLQEISSFTERETLRVENSSISDNLAFGDGAGLWARNYNGDIAILNSTISGNTAAGKGGGAYLRADNNSHTVIENSTISGNQSDLDGGGLWLYSDYTSTFTIQGTTRILENAAAHSGGGVFARLNPDPANTRRQALHISRSLISGNTAAYAGGGATIIGNVLTDALIEDSRFTLNSAVDDPISPSYGGGLFVDLFGDFTPLNAPKVTISGSSIDNNTSDDFGGGILVCAKFSGDVVVVNSTISTNHTLNTSTGAGGGILVARVAAEGETVNAYLRNVTITNNDSVSGGGLSAQELPGLYDVNVRLDNCIVSDNFDLPETEAEREENNIVGPIVVAESFNNLVGTGSTVLDSDDLSSVALNDLYTNNDWIISDTPLLGPLQDNGGPTPTHSLLNDSDAINAGENNYAKDPFTNIDFAYDQRGVGYPRKSGPSVDIGAHEVNAPRVNDVVIRGNGWASGVAYSFADLVPKGRQLAPIFTEGADTIEIHFTEDVVITEDALKLYRTPLRYSDEMREVYHLGSINYDPDTHVATLTFDPFSYDIPFNERTPEMLIPDRYQIKIDPALVTSDIGSTLDGHWDNEIGSATLYDWRDDPTGRPFLSGNSGSGTEFRFLFAYLPGDYDQNGIVDGGDEVVWGHPDGLSDGDGDGLSDKVHTGLLNEDYRVYFYYLGFGLFGTATGDYNHDGQTTFEDYAVWKSHYGFTTFPDADGNNSGVIDTADYTVWRTWWDSQSSTVSAWRLRASGGGVGVEYSDSATAPKVTNITISGSTSTHAAYSFASHVGSGDQLRTVPVGGADTVSITFSEEVNILATDLRVAGLRTYNVPELMDFIYDDVTMTATWRFDDLIANDQYLISLSDFITDTQGYRLDGEWVNPTTTTTTNSLVSEFPSGDGHAGGKFNFVVTLLVADANLDNIVDTADYQIWQTYWAQDGGYLEGDFDGDGIIGDYDLPLWQFTEGLDLQSISMLGDLNNDFLADNSDADIILTNFGMSSATHADGDLDGDGDVDLADVDLFFAQYGLELSLVS